MDTPIYDYAKKYSESGYVRAHMPGHKGVLCKDEISKVYPYDITEIYGADFLFDTNSNGIIEQSEENASKLFNTYKTLYSTTGSTLCIQTMLALTCKEGDIVAASRNSHRAFINACILLGLKIKWIYPDYENGSAISGEITAKAVQNVICFGEKPACVYITSPDYLGKISDIKSISDICKKYDIPLAVDNAHGAYFAFLDDNIHPINLGADLCCDSAHKTLPVLTGGAYLHINNPKYALNAKKYMSLFTSTSPSYLIMQSLDLCNASLDKNYRSVLKCTCNFVKKLKDDLSCMWQTYGDEPLKLVINATENGYTGSELADIMRESKIETEYADDTHILFMFSPSNAVIDYERVYNALMAVPKRERIKDSYTNIFPHLNVDMLPRAAFFAEKELISIDDCAGRICGENYTVCPPCVPIAAIGEKLSDECIKIFKMYSIFEVNVVK